MSKRARRVTRREQRKGPRTLVREGGEFLEARSLDDGLERVGVELLGPSYGIAEASSLVILGNIDRDDDAAEAAADFPNTEPAFLRAVASSALAFARDRDGRDPILVLDMEEVIAVLVAPASALDAFLRERFRTELETGSAPPHHLARWVVAIIPDGRCLRMAINALSLKPVGDA